MNARPVIRRDKHALRKWLHKWFGANRGTHWTIAGSVAVVILGSYLVYSGRDSARAPGAASPAVELTRVPIDVEPAH